jgi:hypothetical protein
MLEKIEQRTKTGQKGCSGEGRGVDRFLRKVGLGKGRLDLELTSSSYPLGDNVEGTLSYELKKPLEGKELWVEVRATQRVTAPKEVTKIKLRGRNERVVKDKTSTLVLYEHRQKLDGHHLYDVGSHQFRLPLPPVIAIPNTGSASPTAKLLKLLKGGDLVRCGPVKWQVLAKLEIPWSLGVSDRKKIQVTESPLTGNPPHTPTPPRQAGKNFCGSCGHQRGPADNFCSSCGQKLR